MTTKNRNRLLVAFILALPLVLFLGFLISEWIKPQKSLSTNPNAGTNAVYSPR